MRILCYAQHLSGIGHYVRTHALASGLADAHDVLLVDGGRPVPRPAAPVGLRLLSLPRIHREDGALAPFASQRPLADVMEERVHRLVAAIAAAPPDVVTIEHYPWSKWELEEEVLALIGAARRSSPGVRVVCSLRDIAPRTRYEAAPEREYEDRVLDRLGAHFDAVLIHADPRFVRLEEYFRSARKLPVPWTYTGFVSTAAVPADDGSHPALSYAVLSAGNGADELPFLLAAGHAFRRLAARDGLGPMRLVIFAGLEAADLDALREGTGGGSTVVLPFSPEFPAWLRRSELSISRAGYNTSVDILNARVPAVLVPHPRMSDQGLRAERMAAHGLAVVVRGDPPTVDVLVEAIRTARTGSAPTHDFALGGVEVTRLLLERLHRTGTLSGVGVAGDPTCGTVQVPQGPR